MSGSVKKIFTVLIVAVGCVLVGAFILNTLLPNTAKVMVDSIENLIFKATGISLDINNNGVAGSNTMPSSGDKTVEDEMNDGNSGNVIEGFN